MRASFTCLAFVAMTLAASAQFSLTPKAGFESSRTSINFNDLRCLSPLGSTVSPQIGLRMDYKFKKTHGPFLAIATNRSGVAFRFDDPETGQSNYSASAGNLQLRLEGGYRYSFKPISLSAKSKQPVAAKSASPRLAEKKGCHKSVSRGSCGDKSKTQVANMRPSINKAWNLRIQPAVGIAYNPSSPEAIVKGANGANYQYNAGNWKTALTTGIDLEFGRGRDRAFVLGFQYLKGITNLGTETLVTQAGTKSTTTSFSSRTSSWNLTVGVPFTLSKKQSRAGQINKTREVKKQCLYYRPCKKA